MQWNSYMKEIIFLVNNLPEGGYETQALTAPIFTEADTLEELWLMIKDAVDCHFEEDERPQTIQLHPI